MSGPQTDFHLQTRSAKKIVVVDLGLLGETIHTLPALWELKRHHPQAALHVITTLPGAEALRLVPSVDRVWPVDQNPQRRTWKDLWAVLRILRHEHFDLAVDFAGTPASRFWTAACGARLRLGHDSDATPFWGRWLVHTRVPRRSRELPVYEQRRQVLAAAGYRLTPVAFDVAVPPEAGQWAEGRIPSGTVHLSINASSPFKEWPLPRWADLCRLLLKDTRLTLVATCGPAERERERLQQLAETVADRRLVALAKDLTIARLSAVLARSAVHVGADSGVTQLAFALGVPTVSVFRDNAGLKEWAPRGRDHWHLTSACECDHKVRAACTMAGEARCLANIPPEAVAGLVHNCID